MALRAEWGKLFAAVLLGIATPAAAGVGPAAAAEAAATRLAPGTAVEAEIAAGEVHRYEVRLDAGDHAGVVAAQTAIDLVVVALSPDGEKLAEVDASGVGEDEEVALAAAAAGLYRIEVRPFTPTPEPAKYAIRLAERLTAAEWEARLAAEREERAAVSAWVAAHALPLAGVEAGRGFEDLRPFGEIVGDARVVALGEATHGTREFFQLKHRLLEYLVAEKGFDVFAIEATSPESVDVDRYVLTGEGDPAAALAGLYFWTWNTEEVLAMIRWMRSWNADPSHRRKVRFFGIDMQVPVRPAKEVLAYLDEVDPEGAAAARPLLVPLADPFRAEGFVRRPQEAKEEAAAAVAALAARFDARRGDAVGRTGAERWERARHDVTLIEQFVSSYSVPLTEGSAVRDRAMADNLAWVLDHAGPDAKVVAWAHNAHVESAEGRMGGYLRRRLGDGLRTVGLVFGSGGFQSLEWPRAPGSGLRRFEVGPPAEDSLDAVLAGAGVPLFALDLRRLPEAGPGAWLRAPRRSRLVGSMYGGPFADAAYIQHAAPQVYDALFFVAETTAARGNPGAERTVPPRRAVPVNFDFETDPEAGGEDGSPPAGWVPVPGLGAAQYAITSSAERPFEGTRCGEVRRRADARYGEVYGAMVQSLDAAPYRGKRLRLRAAARTEGVAHLWLEARRPAFGPEAVAARADTAGHPITGAEWTAIELTLEVPPEVEEVLVGFALDGAGRAFVDAVRLDVVPE